MSTARDAAALIGMRVVVPARGEKNTSGSDTERAPRPATLGEVATALAQQRRRGNLWNESEVK